MGVRVTSLTAHPFSRTTGLPGWNATSAGWFYWETDGGAFQTLFNLSFDGNNNDGIFFDTGSSGRVLIQPVIGGVFNRAYLRSDVTPGQWVYIAMARSGSVLTGYCMKPGESVVTKVTFTQAVAAGLPVRWECGDGVFSLPIAAYTASAVKVWDASLTDNELLQEMRQALPVRTANLLGFYPFHSLSESVVDYSGGARNLTTIVSANITSSPLSPPIAWGGGRLRLVRPRTAVVVPPPALAITTLTLPDAVSGVPYNPAITAHGGVPPYTFSLRAGTLPPGLSLTAAGVVSGLPALLGTIAPTTLPLIESGVPYSQQLTLANDTSIYAFTVRVTDSVGTSADQSYTIFLSADPASFTLVSGVLPAGLTLSSAGLLAGTTTVAGSIDIQPATIPPGRVDKQYRQQFTVGAAADAVYPITVHATTHGLSPANQSYTLVVSGFGSIGAVQFTGGAFPKCLSLSLDGLLKGPPITVGIYTFTIRATDTEGRTLERVYTFTVTSK